MEIELLTLKLGLVAFWGLWFFIVFVTNLFAGLQALGAISPRSKFASQNYELVAKATAIYKVPRWLPGILFCSVILWQLLAVALFTSAFAASLSAKAIAFGAVNTAFATGCALWAAFMLADEVFMQYNNERSHIMLFIAQLATLIALHVLPS